MLSRETKFTETRPIEPWTLTAIEAGVHAALREARKAGAPEGQPTLVFFQLHRAIGSLPGSLYTTVAWGSALDSEPDEDADAGH